MTPAEQRDPSIMLESRRMDIADAANVTDRQLSEALNTFEQFANSAPMRRRLGWLTASSIYLGFFGLPGLLVALITGLVLLILSGPR